MEKHLPAVRLDQQSTELFVKELSTAMSVAETKALAQASIVDQRTAVLSKISSLHPLLTREECDRCLADLSLVVPSQNLSDADTARKLDLYFGLFAMRGVTRNMLRQACAEFAMAPRVKGKDKFFPDPGTLFEFMADAARERARSLKRLQRALDVLDGKLLPEIEPGSAPMPPHVAAILKTFTKTVTDAAPAAKPWDGRESNTEELKAALQRRQGGNCT